MNEIMEFINDATAETTTTTTTPKGLLKQYASKSASNLKKETLEKSMNTFAASFRKEVITVFTALEDVQAEKKQIILDLMPTNIMSTSVNINTTAKAKEYIRCVEKEQAIANLYDALSKEYTLLTGKTFKMDSEIE